MWRTILIGKLIISCLASSAIGVTCIRQPQIEGFEFASSARWTGLGIFFLVLAVVQIFVIYLLLKKKKHETKKKLETS